MTNLNKIATFSLITLMSTAPLAAFATDTGSPQQSVDADPDEKVAKKPLVEDGAVVSEEAGSPQLSVDTDEDESVAMGEADGEGTIADELPTNSPAVSGS